MKTLDSYISPEKLVFVKKHLTIILEIITAAAVFLTVGWYSQHKVSLQQYIPEDTIFYAHLDV